MTEANSPFNSSLVWFFTFIWCSGLGASLFILLCVYALKKHWQSEAVTPEIMHHDRLVYKNAEQILAERSFEVFLDRLLCDYSCSADLLVHVKRFRNFLQDENNRYLSTAVQKRAGALAASIQPMVVFIDEYFRMLNDAPVVNDIQLRMRTALLSAGESFETRYRPSDMRKISRFIRKIKKRNRLYRAAVKETLHV